MSEPADSYLLLPSLDAREDFLRAQLGLELAERQRAGKLMEYAAHRIMHAAKPENVGISWTYRTYEGEERQSLGFYNGISGIAYFLFKAFASTGQVVYRTYAENAMQFLLKHKDLNKVGRGANGLFDGAAGLGYVFLYAHICTGQGSYLETAKEIASGIVQAPDTSYGAPVDMVSGASGTGLFLLKMYIATVDPVYLRGAETLGQFLIRRAEPAAIGAKWKCSARDGGQYITGFAHGVAGICYFLKRLHRMTGQETWNNSADAGLRYLQHIATRDLQEIKWPRDDFRLRNVFPSQWCHGAAGMNALFLSFYLDSGQDQYLDWAIGNTRYLISQGVNVKKNASICHGISGNAASLCCMYKALSNPEYLLPVREGIGILETTAERTSSGYYWPSALSNQLDYGYMSGIAGIADFCLFLHSDGVTNLMSGLGFGDEF